MSQELREDPHENHHKAEVTAVLYMSVSKNSGTPKSSILIGLSINSTIHFGGKFSPYFLVQHPKIEAIF